jgi:hypothetical protein
VPEPGEARDNNGRTEIWDPQRGWVPLNEDVIVRGALPRTFEDGSPLPGPVIDKLKPYFEGFDLTQIRIHKGIPAYVVGHPKAYTSKNDIYFAEGAYDPNTARGLSLIGHEVLHSRQYQELGTLGFRARYLTEYMNGRLSGESHDKAYRNISLEQDAFALQQQILFDLIQAGYP